MTRAALAVLAALLGPRCAFAVPRELPQLPRAAQAAPAPLASEAAGRGPQAAPNAQASVPAPAAPAAAQGPADPRALAVLLDQALRPDFDGDAQLRLWQELEEPFVGERPRGLDALRQAVRKDGLVTVLSGEPPASRARRRKLERLHGGRLAFAGEAARAGVAVHLPGRGDAVANLNAARAAINPYLGYAYLHGLLRDKLLEYRFAEAVLPGSMPRGSSFGDLANAGRLPAELFDRRTRLAAELDVVLRGGRQMSAAEEGKLRGDLAALSESFFAGVDAAYPDGAFVKNYGEFLTGDYKTQIMSFKRDSEKFARQFVLRLRETARHGPYPGGLSDQRFQKRFMRRWHLTGAKFLNALLVAPERLLIQKRERLALDGSGFALEVRVDFVDGEPLRVSNRTNTPEFLEDEHAQAAQAIRELFARAPAPFRHLAGGADLAKLEDGRWVIIEFNVGNESGTLSPHVVPLGANEAKSALLGRPTPLLARFERAFQKGPAAQRRLLKSLKTPRWRFARDASELSLQEAALWMRDRYLREWRKEPTREGAETALRELSKLFDGVGARGHALIDAARRYVERVLRSA